jgi:hypothetical protein
VQLSITHPPCTFKEAAALKERNEKLEKVVEAAKSWLAVADTYAKHRDDPDRSVYKMDYMRGREIFRDALKELEQP